MAAFSRTGKPLPVCKWPTRSSRPVRTACIISTSGAIAVKPQRSIVFLSTCAAVDYFQHVLPSILPAGFSLIPLHGKHPAKVREKNFNRFLTSVSPTILLTTDLAARGLDIPQVDVVVQIDAPSDPKVFIHRERESWQGGQERIVSSDAAPRTRGGLRKVFGGAEDAHHPTAEACDIRIRR